jgi:hypothetical protein
VGRFPEDVQLGESILLYFISFGFAEGDEVSCGPGGCWSATCALSMLSRAHPITGTYGGTDEIGLRAVSGVVDTYDVQATILNQLGLDHRKLTYPYQGRSERATAVYGQVVKEIIT